MLLCAAAAWAVAIVFVRAHRFRSSAIALAPWQMLVAASLLLPLARIVDGPLSGITPRAAASLAYVGPLATAFAYWAVVEAGRKVRATTMSVALLAVPGVGLLISAIALHEPVSASLLIGGFFISSAVLLVNS